MLLIPKSLDTNIKPTKYKTNILNKNFKHAYILKYFSPFLSIINKGVKEKNVLPLFVRNKKSTKGYK